MTPKSILIVDDEEDILSLLQIRFAAEGYDVRVATNGVDALAQIDKAPPDLVILDVMMKKMNGMEVKARLNRKKETADIPVIFLTANTLTENKVAGFQLNADDYVTKPFDFKELLARVQALLSRR